MSKVKDIARALIAKLETNGSSGMPVRYGELLPSSQAEIYDDYGSVFDPFLGYSVSSVVIDETESDERIYLFLSNGRIPKNLECEIDGINIIAAKIAPFKTFPDRAVNVNPNGCFYKKDDFVACGSSCALLQSADTGTVGAIVYDGQNHFILSNNHVIAGCNHAIPYTPLYSPSYKDRVAMTNPPVMIGKYFNANVLVSACPAIHPMCSTDSAIAELNEGTMCSWQGDDINGYDTPSQTIAPAPRMKVKKFGRTTGFTTGVIIGEILDDKCRVHYKNANFNGDVYFQNAWFVQKDGNEAFAEEGDSGSLVVTEDGAKSVGLLFAISSGYGVIIPIERVLSQLKELVRYDDKTYDPVFTLASGFYGVPATGKRGVGEESVGEIAK